MLDIHKKHLIESLQSYQYLNDLETPSTPIKLDEEDRFTKDPSKKLLVFDMDETLIHCVPDPKPDTECCIKIPYSYTRTIKYKYVNIRPYVLEVLSALSKMYKIVVFTASTQEYADPILDYLDKDRQIIENRYYRHH